MGNRLMQANHRGEGVGLLHDHEHYERESCKCDPACKPVQQPKRKGFYEENPPDDWEHCGCCDGYHPVNFAGDCRDDMNRWPGNKAIARLEGTEAAKRGSVSAAAGRKKHSRVDIEIDGQGFFTIIPELCGAVIGLALMAAVVVFLCSVRFFYLIPFPLIGAAGIIAAWNDLARPNRY